MRIVLIAIVTMSVSLTGFTESLEIVGTTVTPHLMLDSMRYRVEPEPPDGARVQLFIQNSGNEAVTLDGETDVRFNGETPEALLKRGAWAWHDMPGALNDQETELQPGAMSVMTFNGRQKPWGVGGEIEIEFAKGSDLVLDSAVDLDDPEIWLSAVTFMGDAEGLRPNRMVVHIANDASRHVDLQGVEIRIPGNPEQPRVFNERAEIRHFTPFNGQFRIPGSDKGGFVVETEPLPQSYAIVEVTVKPRNGDAVTLRAHLRIKKEVFDISGGWVNDRNNNLTNEAFLRTLKRLHVNTAHIGIHGGYTDTLLYEKYPLKYFSSLRPFEVYDTDEVLPRVHAAEFLGEPQYGGGTPVPPQNVWEALQPYATTRIPTTVTHSEERIWRDYAGLSDFPHYDAYRVSAPSPDSWVGYTDRWDGERIAWGAPLETIGDMCRSLRELNRPVPCAYWSQGPHSGWGVYGGRQRTSPTPDELRLQAYHALSTRITSLYWFNLQVSSLVTFRDTYNELARIGREIRLIDEFLLEGDAYRFERRTERGKLDWDLASVTGPRAALLFALDNAYVPDPDERVFAFGALRAAEFRFELPAYLGDIADVFRLDADGIHEVIWSQSGGTIRIQDEISRVGMYLATPHSSMRLQIEAERQTLIAVETALDMEPGTDDDDFKALRALVPAKE